MNRFIALLASLCLIAQPVYGQTITAAPNPAQGASGTVQTSNGAGLNANSCVKTDYDGTNDEIILGGFGPCAAYTGANTIWFKGAYGNVGALGMGNSDAGWVMKHPSGVDPYAAIYIGADNSFASGGIVDFEPDNHFKLHSNAGNYPSEVSPTLSGCGTGATIDYGSNDGLWRLTFGTSPTAACRITWTYAYANEPPHWNNMAPVCDVWNEGSRASGTVTFVSNTSAGKHVVIEGVSIAFVASGATGNQVNVGATKELTTTAFFNFLAGLGVTPGAAPGVDSALTHYRYTNPTTNTVGLLYTYADGVTGNAATITTDDAGNITVPATLSGGALPAFINNLMPSPGTGSLLLSGTPVVNQVEGGKCFAGW